MKQRVSPFMAVHSLGFLAVDGAKPVPLLPPGRQRLRVGLLACDSEAPTGNAVKDNGDGFHVHNSSGDALSENTANGSYL